MRSATAGAEQLYGMILPCVYAKTGIRLFNSSMWNSATFGVFKGHELRFALLIANTRRHRRRGHSAG
jgi:hypothetical protein